MQSGGALTIAATSALNTGSLSSQARLTLDAAQLDNTGLVHAGAAAQLRVATLNNPGVIAATGALSLTGQQLTNAGTLGAGLAPDAQGKLQPLASSDPRAAAAALTIRATDQLTQTATGQLLAGGQLQVTAGAALLEGRATATTLAIAGERGLHLEQAELHATQDAALRSDGELTLDQSRLLAQGDVRVDAARSTLTDSTVQAGGRADANIAGALTLQSTQAGLPTALRAAGDVTVNAERLTTRRSGDGSAALLAAGLLPDGRLAGSGDLTLSTAAALQSDAVMLSAGTARLTGRDLQLAQAQVQGQQVQLHALRGDLDTRQAQVHAVDRLSAKAGTLLNSGGQLSADRLDLQLDRLDNRAGTLLHTGTAALDLELTTLDNRGGLIGSNATDLRIQAQTLATDGGQIQHAGTGRFTLQARQFSAAPASGRAAEVLSGGQLALTATDAALGGARITAEHLRVSATQLSGADAQLAARGGELAVTVTGPQAVDLRRATLQSAGSSLLSTAGDLLTDGATLGAYQDLTIRTGGTLQHGGGAQAVAGRDLALIADRLDQGDRPGAVSAAGAAAASPSGFTALAGSLDARVSGALTAQDGQWIAGRALSLAAQDISLSGARTQLAAGQAPGSEGGLSVIATAGLTASDTLLAANGSLKLGGAHVALTGSQVTGQDVTLTAHGADDATSPAAHLDRSLVTARRDLTLEATTGSLVLSASQAQAGHTLALTGSTAVVLDSGSAAVSQGDLRLGGARGVNAGTVQADGQLTLTTAALTNTGSLSGARALQLQGERLDNAGTVYSRGSGQVQSHSLTNTGIVAAGGPLALEAQRLQNDGLIGAGLSPDAQGRLQWAATPTGTGALTITSTDTLSQGARGQLLASDQLQASAGRIDLAGAASAAAVALHTTGALQLRQAQLSATQDAALTSAGTLTLDQSQVLAGRDARLTSAQALGLTDSLVQATGRTGVQAGGALTLQSTQASWATALRAGGDLGVNADTLATSRSGTGALLAAGLQADGRLAGTGALTVHTTGTLQSEATLLAAGAASLSGSALQLANAQLQGQAVQLQATAGAIDTSAARVQALSTLTATDPSAPILTESETIACPAP